MELTKADKRQLHDLIKRGVLRRCEEWLKETADLINKEYGEDENAFDRCMEITKRSHDYFKEAMRREDYFFLIVRGGCGLLIIHLFVLGQASIQTMGDEISEKR